MDGQPNTVAVPRFDSKFKWPDMVLFSSRGQSNSFKIVELQGKKMSLFIIKKKDGYLLEHATYGDSKRRIHQTQTAECKQFIENRSLVGGLGASVG